MFGAPFGYASRGIFSGLAMPLMAIAIAAASVVALVILDNAKKSGSLEAAAARNAEIAMANQLGREEDKAIFQQTLEAQGRVNSAATDARVAAAERQARREAHRQGMQEGREQGRQDALSEAQEATGPGGLPYCPADCLLEPPA